MSQSNFNKYIEDANGVCEGSNLSHEALAKIAFKLFEKDKENELQLHQKETEYLLKHQEAELRLEAEFRLQSQLQIHDTDYKIMESYYLKRISAISQR
jgi:hypothetical protein